MLLDLPTEVIVKVMKLLHITDCASLTLTCKRMARIAMTHQTLEYDLDAPTDTTTVVDFFAMLGLKWGSNDYNFCKRCGKYQSLKRDVWKERGQIRASRMGGHQTAYWASGKLDTVIRDWCAGVLITCPSCVASFLCGPGR